MAQKRMFAKTIIDSDVFLDMPQTTQNLYFHLNMRADDEGFINSPRKIMRVIQANTNDLDILKVKKFVIEFESGVIVIKHWKLHNTIRKDRIKKTLYTEERALLFEKENGSYTFNKFDNVMKIASSDDLEQLEDHATTWQPHDNRMSDNSQHRLDKISIDKIRLEENSIEKNNKKEQEQPCYIPQPKNTLSNKITEAIDYWNELELPKCAYTIFTLPSVADVKEKFDVYRDGEILAAIKNLSLCFDKIEVTYRPKVFHKFITNSLDNWLDTAEPLKQFENVEKSYRTQEEKRYYMVLDMAKKNPGRVPQEDIDRYEKEMNDSFKPKEEITNDGRF